MLRNKEVEQQCRHLWRICFDDSEELINLYFNRRANDENTFVHSLRGGVVASQSQCLTYGLSEKNGPRDYLLGYVSGIATLPEYRGHGYARDVMRQMLVYMAEKGMDYAFLIPANAEVADWYARHFDFRHTHDYIKYLIQQEKLDGLRKLDVDDLNAVSDVLKFSCGYINERNHYLLQDLQYYIDQWEVCEMSGGGVYSMKDPWKAVLFVEIIDGKPVVLEIFAHTPEELEKTKSLFQLKVFARVPIMSVPVCAQVPLPADAHFSLLLD